MKDPAFLFYSSDFLSGTMLMSDEQIGQYIKLLCLQHQKGHLKEKDMLNICKTYDEDIFSKFKKDEEDNYYNERLDEEAERRKKYSESRRNNRKKRDTEGLEEEKEETHVEDMKNICNSYEEHMGTETETITITKNINNKYKDFKNIYNTCCTNLSEVKKITDKRKIAINKFLKEFDNIQFREICINANNSEFLTGHNDRGWKADFDFLIRTDKAVKILEGQYDYKKQAELSDWAKLWKEAKEDEQGRNDTGNSLPSG